MAFKCFLLMIWRTEAEINNHIERYFYEIEHINYACAGPDPTIRGLHPFSPDTSKKGCIKFKISRLVQIFRLDVFR